MSQENLEWLNKYTLQSRAVWHTDENLQKICNTIYDGAIPVQDVLTRLFAWKAVEGDITSTGTTMNEGGVHTFTITDPDRKAMLRPPGALGPDDLGAIMGVFKSGYQGHDYEDWLVHNVATILDDELGIYSAGLLKGGAQAWVQVSVPETITTPEGVIFRPNLLAVTSFDGSMATTYKRTAQDTVCDNTRDVALRSEGEQFKLKHSKNSGMKIMAARDALNMIHTLADDFAAQVAELTSIKVSDGDWAKFLDSLVPIPDEKGRSQTMAENKQADLMQMWNADPRVAPWKGSAWGALQAVNTHAHWNQTVRGKSREERNQEFAITGQWGKLDGSTLETLMGVLA